MTSAIFQPHAHGHREAKSTHATILSICIAVALFLILLAIAHPAHACPSCAVGQQARSEVLGDHFASNLLIALLPFVLIGGISLRAEVIGLASRREDRSDAR